MSTLGTKSEISSGLGLLLFKEFIEMHDGKLWIESYENSVSKFSITLQGENGHEN